MEHTLNGVKVTLSDNTYDNFGRLLTSSLHGSATNKVIYAYNLRSWLTGISSVPFTQNLYYTDGSNAAKCYNGNISSMTWQGSDGVTRGYKFSYDGLNRLANAAYGETSSISTNLDRFTEKVTGYDKNGNITGLQRYGQTSASAYGLMDNLSFTLAGNQLNRIDDAVSVSAYNNGFDFKDGVKQAGEYAYDANGNLTKDLNKGISSIQYNVLNLPSAVTFSDGSTITHTYALDGRKLRTVHNIGSTTTTTDYCDNVIYENGIAKLLLTGYGYVSLNDNKYHYYLQDHQGNNRAVINQAGAVEETSHYYPFGGTFANSTSVQPYKYNGKELDTKKGLNWYDYGARHYDAAVGRFTTVDPLAEASYSAGAYTYCLNNPVNLIDPTGCLVSTHTDSCGNVVDVFYDLDLSVYKHNTDKEGTKQELAESYSSTDTAAGGEKMGETYEWNSFLKGGTGNPTGHINFGSLQASQAVFNKFRYLSKVNIKSAELAIYALNANNGELFDIKYGGPYEGHLFGLGKYVTMRDAGNILAGMVARRGGLSAKTTYALFGALQLSENSRARLPFYLNAALKLGEKGSYGETPISHIFQKRGYELNFK